jgi:hypothetical protein
MAIQVTSAAAADAALPDVLSRSEDVDPGAWLLDAKLPEGARLVFRMPRTDEPTGQDMIAVEYTAYHRRRPDGMSPRATVYMSRALLRTMADASTAGFDPKRSPTLAMISRAEAKVAALIADERVAETPRRRPT